MQPVVFVTRNIPPEGLAILEDKFQVLLHSPDRPATRKELAEGIAGAHGLLCMLNDRIDQSLLKKGPHLKVVANLAVGIDNIDLSACRERGIAVTNTPDVLTEATADLAFALLLAAARRVVEGDRFVRDGKFTGWDPLLLVGGDLHGKTLGIIGMGRIGRAVARRAAGFGMSILYHNRNRLSLETEQSLEASYVQLEPLLRESDYVSLHLPYSAESHHMINAARLAMMKPTAYLVNTARGAHIDEQALVTCLRERRIAGAALDVYEHEPALAPGLVELKNVVLAPHAGSAGRETRAAMAVLAARSIVDFLEGRRPEHLVWGPDSSKEG